VNQQEVVQLLKGITLMKNDMKALNLC